MPTGAEKISIYGNHGIANQRAVLHNYYSSPNVIYSAEPFILIIRIRGVTKLVGSKKGNGMGPDRRHFIEEWPHTNEEKESK
jgi:hypothetical protein